METDRKGGPWTWVSELGIHRVNFLELQAKLCCTFFSKKFWKYSSDSQRDLWSTKYQVQYKERKRSPQDLVPKLWRRQRKGWVRLLPTASCSFKPVAQQEWPHLTQMMFSDVTEDSFEPNHLHLSKPNLPFIHKLRTLSRLQDVTRSHHCPHFFPGCWSVSSLPTTNKDNDTWGNRSGIIILQYSNVSCCMP